MNKTKIQWCDYSTNPVKAVVAGGKKGWFCTKVSEGCRNCYSEGLNRRFGNGLSYSGQNADRVGFKLDEAELKTIVRKKAPAGSRVFVCDMTDLFHPAISDDIVDQVFAAMAVRSDLIFMVLTKRPANMLRYLTQHPGFHRAAIIAERAMQLGDFQYFTKTGTAMLGHKISGLTADKVRAWPGYPFANIQLGVTVENQDTANERIPLLLQCPAAVRFVSYEPALGPVDFTPSETTPWIRGLDGIIAGGESGTHARPAHPAWFRKVRDDCQTHSVPFFFKQWGEWAPLKDHFETAPGNAAVCLVKDDGRVVRPYCEGDAPGTIMVNVGKAVSGRLLDEQTHNDLPRACQHHAADSEGGKP